MMFGMLLLAGNPTTNDQNGVPLPATLQELEEISNHFESSNLVLLEGSQLTLEALIKAMNDSPGIIHIASHAVLNLEYPELSSILLSGQSASTGSLKPENEYLMPIDIGSVNLDGSLVVLSACETAGSQQFSFDSNLGFVSEFMNSGANFVVASLWPVGDRFSFDFMTHFYTHLAKGSTPAQALTFTKRTMQKTSKHNNLNQWAAFQLYQN
jgi:CHAT domain-containing protein